MSTPLSITKCVAFAAWKKRRDMHIGGTVFFLVHEIEGTSQNRSYVVTARHVVENASRLSDDGLIYLRVNVKNGSSQWLKTSKESWEFHSKENVDVAMLPFDWDYLTDSELNHLPLASDFILTDSLIGRLDIGAGDALYFPGLFVRHYGNRANVPILRTGTLAAVYPDPVPLKHGGEMLAYLAELRSIGGHSGSPVMIHFDGNKRSQLSKKMDDGEFSDITGLRPQTFLDLGLLGIMHGHFTLRPDQYSGVSPTDSMQDYGVVDNSEDFNSGIGIIIPAKEILAVLKQPRLVADRAREREKIIRSQGFATPD